MRERARNRFSTLYDASLMHDAPMVHATRSIRALLSRRGQESSTTYETNLRNLFTPRARSASTPKWWRVYFLVRGELEQGSLRCRMSFVLVPTQRQATSSPARRPPP